MHYIYIRERKRQFHMSFYPAVFTEKVGTLMRVVAHGRRFWGSPATDDDGRKDVGMAAVTTAARAKVEEKAASACAVL